MKDPRIKKGAAIELLQDFPFDGTIIPAGTRGKVLIKHNVSGSWPGQLWVRLDHHYCMVKNDTEWIRYVEPDGPPPQVVKMDFD